MMTQDSLLQNESQKAVEVADGLDKMAKIVDTLGDDIAINELSKGIRSRAISLRNDRFSIVVVGGFSKGKSTLLNAILGVDILPQKMIPSTAIITKLEYAEQPCARVRYVNEQTPEDILSLDQFRQRFVLTEKDSDNGKMTTDRFSHIDHAIVSYPIELCRYRVELVDSPGLKDDPVRTERTRKFLKSADAIVMVLDTQRLCDEDEREFLTTVLLPEGLTNIFFVINKWNLVEESMLRPEDAKQAFAELENRIQTYLLPFCVIEGQDRSAERIFRVNALGALKARMKSPPSLALLEESNIPALEESLQRFLVEERGRAKNSVIHSAVQSTAKAVTNYIAAQQKLGEKSVEEIEKELKNLKPQLDHLKGIRDSIVNFLNGKSNNLQDILASSFHDHIFNKILPKVEKVVGLPSEIPDDIEEFDFSEVFGWSITWKALVDRWKDEEDKLAKQVERSLEPQVQKWLNREFAPWRQSVIQNVLPAAQIDVEKHLQAEAEQYRRVLRDIEEQLGIHGDPASINELVKDWLRTPDNQTGEGKFNVSGIGAIGDMGWLIGSIVADIALEIAAHLATVWIPIVGMVFSAIRAVARESGLRKQVRTKFAEGIRESLVRVATTQGSKIREQVRANFEELKATVTGNINEQIMLLEASCQSILDRKRDREFSVEEMRQRLETTRSELTVVVGQISDQLLT